MFDVLSPFSWTHKRVGRRARRERVSTTWHSEGL